MLTKLFLTCPWDLIKELDENFRDRKHAYHSSSGLAMVYCWALDDDYKGRNHVYKLHSSQLAKSTILITIRN